MHKVWAITGTIAAITFGLLLWLAPPELVDVYQGKLQTPLFSGFLTLGGFLLSLKTAILMRLKDELYGKDEYRKSVERAQSIQDPKKPVTYYGPLRRLGHFLISSVLWSLATACMQLTVGFIPSKVAAALCLTAAAASLSLVFFAWREIRANLDYWFEFLDSQQKSAGHEPKARV